MELNQEVIETTMENLRKNNMQAICVDTKEEALKEVLSRIQENDVVGVGGSVTLDQIGLIPKLREMPIRFLDRYAPNLSGAEIMSLHRALSTSDVFISSSNAITMDGALYNVDGTGNRVTAMAFGPKKVLVVAGVNKIVPDFEAAKERVKKIAAPLNNKRLNRKNPCVVTGTCMDCKSPERICNMDVLLRRQADPQRLTVILVKEQLGY